MLAMKTVDEKDLLFFLLLSSFFDSSYCEGYEDYTGPIETISVTTAVPLSSISECFQHYQYRVKCEGAILRKLDKSKLPQISGCYFSSIMCRLSAIGILKLSKFKFGQTILKLCSLKLQNISVTTEAANIAKDEHICFQIDSRDYCLKTSFKSVAQWKDSIAQCSAIGATLVTKLTSTLMSDISSKLHQIFSELKMSESVKFIWVGLSYTGDSNGNFEWLNKEKLSSESALWDSGFYGGQPNNHDGRVGESCAALRIQTAKLVDLNCNRPQFFMCTKDD